MPHDDRAVPCTALPALALLSRAFANEKARVDTTSRDNRELRNASTAFHLQDASRIGRARTDKRERALQ